MCVCACVVVVVVVVIVIVIAIRIRKKIIITPIIISTTFFFPVGGGEGGSVMQDGQRATLDTLTPWTNYSVTVAGFTKAGQGVSSPAVICTTEQDGEDLKKAM